MKYILFIIMVVFTVCFSIIDGRDNKNHFENTLKSENESKVIITNEDTRKDKEKQITYEKIDELLQEIGLENATSYEQGIDGNNDQIIFLCESQSGRYKVYGFVSPEYGLQGVLINNIIDGEDNTNYFYEKWFYTEEQPAISESDDFYKVVLRICDDETGKLKEIYFDTFDTGTMSPRNDW